MNIKTADRIASVKEYYFSKKMSAIALLNEQGKKVINLGIGSPDMAPDSSIINTLIDSAQHPKNHSYQSFHSHLSIHHT